jgi:hypothetical protein
MTSLEIVTSIMNYIESLFFKEFENIIFFIICSSLSFIILFLSISITVSTPYSKKFSSYECGFNFLVFNQRFFIFIILIFLSFLFEGPSCCDDVATPADVEEKGGVPSNKAIGAYLFVFTSIGFVMFGVPAVVGVIAFQQVVDATFSPESDFQPPLAGETVVSVTTASEVAAVGTETGGILLFVVIIVTICATLSIPPVIGYRRALSFFLTTGTIVGNVLGHTLDLEPIIPREPDSQAPSVVETVNPTATTSEVENKTVSKIPTIIVQPVILHTIVAVILILFFNEKYF